MVGNIITSATVVFGNIRNTPPCFQIERLERLHRRTPERINMDAIPQIGFREIQFRQLIGAAVQPVQLRIVAKIELRQLIVIAGQCQQLRIAAKIECSQLIVIAIQIVQLRMVAKIQRSQLIVIAVQRPQLRIVVKIE